MNKRIVLIALSLLAAALLMLLLYLLTPAENPNRILVMLGGNMPAGIIQGITYFFFIWGVLEVCSMLSRITDEQKALEQHLLPEKENWLLGADDVNKIKLETQQLEHMQKFLITDLVIKACTKYRLSKSASEVISLVDSQVKSYSDEMESEQSFISYSAWAIPSVGFVGTVLGIAASLGYANEAGTPEGLAKVTGMLGVAFDTTLVALVLSIFLMGMIHYLQKRQDHLFAQMNSYIIENLINRLYK